MVRFATSDPLERQLLFIVAGALLLILSVLTYGATSSYQGHLSRAEALTSIEAQSLADHALRTFDRVELQLENLVDTVEQNPSWLTTFQPAVTDYFDRITLGFSFMRSVILINADGMMVNDNAARDGRLLNLSDRDYFLAHKDSTNVGTFVGRPVVGRVTEKLLIGVSRRISRPDGTFAGVAAVIFEPLYFKGTRELQKGPSGADEGLVYEDGTILVGGFGGIGAKLPELRGALGRARTGGAALDRVALSGGKDSIVALHSVPDRPLVTVVVRPLGAALAAWRTDVWKFAGIGAVSVALIVFMAVVMRRQLAARSSAERARAEALNGLTLANENLARSNRDLQEFAQVASHDLQEPLRKIRYFSEKLRDARGDTVSENEVNTLNRLDSATERMQRLINDLLDFARVTTRAKPFIPVPLDNAVADALSNLEAAIAGAKAEITAAPLPRIEADRTQMVQLFQNLVGNAVKYRRADGTMPQVSIFSEDGPNNRKDACRIVVEDNGIGFDQKYADRIFQPFQRLHGRNAYEGAGMGLAICRKIVERHGGTLTGEGRVDEGARFIVTLPVRHKKEEIKPCPSEATPLRSSLPTMIPTTAR